MKLLFLLLILISTIIFLIQNQQPVILHFLGTDPKTALFTLELPIGIWVILFSAAGIITSLILQLLTPSLRSSAPKTVTPPPRQEPPNPSPRSSQPLESTPSAREIDWGEMPKPNWEGTEPELTEDDNGWDIETPPAQPTFVREQLERELREQENQTNFEVQQAPKKASRQGSVYSYTYRELRDTEDSPPTQETVSPPPQTPETPRSKNKTDDQVYDANYRILTPPYQTSQPIPPDDDEDDEDWVE